MDQFENHITIDTVEKALKGKLPGDEAHLTMLPKGRSLAPPVEFHQMKQSAVMILLFEENETLNVCLTKRNSNMKHHAGQISFPGGRCEKAETNAWQTALRETEEEIGVPGNKIKLMGKLTNLYVSVSNYNIHPFVGFYSEKPQFKRNKHEVDEIITLPLSSILELSSLQYAMIETSTGNLNVPCFKINKWVIWGATAMMLAELKAMLTSHFQHRATN